MTTTTSARLFYTIRPAPDFLTEGSQPACREPGVDPELFFPLGEYSDEARAVCRRCPLEVDCATWAIDSGEQWGIWGGLDPEQRKARRQMARSTA